MPYFGRIDEFKSGEESWECYSERCLQFFEANDIEEDKKRVAVLLTSIGGKVYQELWDSVAPKKPSAHTYAEIDEIMTKRYNPESTVILQRFRFHTRKQQEGEDIATFVGALRRIASKCKFTNFLEDSLRDQLVVGIRDDATQKRLLGTENLTLAEALKIASAMEAALKDCREMKTQLTATTVHKMSEGTKSPVWTCYCCGEQGHIKPDCNKKHHVCSICKVVGHLENLCRKKDKGKTGKKPKPKESRVKYMGDSDSSTEEIYKICDDEVVADDPYTVNVKLNGTTVKMEIDTGSKRTIISEKEYNKIQQLPPLMETKHVLKTYSGERLMPVGSIKVHVIYGDQEHDLEMLVAPGKAVTLFGRDWLKVLKLDWQDIFGSHVNLVNCDEFPEIFETTGVMKDVEVSLHVKPGSTPKFSKARSLPYALRGKVEDELERLVKEGTISPVTSSQWASAIVPVLKENGRVRICGDYKEVNKALVTEVFPLPTPEDLFATLSAGRVFSKLDLCNAYLQLPVSTESKEILTINTHKGLFTYNSLPFGISSSPALFQRTMETLLKGIPGVGIYLDDILVSGSTEEEHDSRLNEVFKRLSESGIRLRKEKCELSVKEVKYLGHKISGNGIEVLNKKVEAIAKVPQPQNKAEVQAFIGMITYYDKFLPQLSTVLEPLHQLLRKDAKFKWSSAQQKSFEKCTQMLQESPLLTHYDPKKKLLLTVDASKYGVGAVLSHEYEDGLDRPIAFKSRKLNKSERNYGQIDKEALAIAFGITKFHKYLYGRHFKVITDHTPLLGLLGEGKRLPDMTSPRLQRFALRMSAYDYNLIHKPGTKIGNADGLSRLPFSDEPKESDMPPIVVLSMTVLDTSPISCDNVRIWTNTDPVLSKVKDWLLSGWPNEAALQSEEYQPYFKRRNELSLESGCILWGSRVVIPSKGREKLLEELHTGHPGASRMKSLARGYIWWPSCDNDITEYVKQCSLCQHQQPVPAAAPLHPWEFPHRPWARVHVDYAGPFEGHMFLVIADSYSKWIEVHKVKKSTSEVTIRKLRQTFATHGLPEIIVSDNGACFTSSEFKDYAKSQGIKLLNSAPYHPASNGLAENAVKVFKQGMKKVTNGTINERMYQILFAHRITPHTSTGIAPSELLMGRRLRSRLELIKPSLKEKVQSKQMQQKWYHDKRAKERTLEIGDPVYAKMYRGQEKWSEGIIAERTGPVSYNVEGNNQILHRHIDQLRFRSAPEHQVLPPDVIPDVILPSPHKEVIVVDPPSDATSTTVATPAPAATDTLNAPEPSVRRSNRTNKGVPAQRFE